MNNPMINMTISRQSPTCGGNGSIIVSANGGTPAYQYSINGGTTFQPSPVFSNLSGGNYIVVVKDINNVTSTQSVTLLSPPPNQTYQIILALTGPNSFNVTVSPALPIGASINYTLKHNSVFNVAPTPTVATYNNVVTVVVNGNPITTPSPFLNTSTVFNSCNSGTKYKNTNVTTWPGLIFGVGTTVTGTFTNTVNPITPLVKCYSVVVSTNLFIDSATLVNCNCCNLIVKNPPYNK